MEPLWQTAWADLQVTGTVVLAMALGAAIGWDRELADKPAGIRTHALVAGAASLLVSLGTLLPAELAEALAPAELRSDPVRVMEAVITGVSFLGAGTIIRGRGQRVEGLTTAAAMLTAAAIGMSVGVGHVVLAVSLTVVVVGVLRFPTARGRNEVSSS